MRRESVMGSCTRGPSADSLQLQFLDGAGGRQDPRNRPDTATSRRIEIDASGRCPTVVDQRLERLRRRVLYCTDVEIRLLALVEVEVRAIRVRRRIHPALALDLQTEVSGDTETGRLDGLTARVHVVASCRIDVPGLHGRLT